MLRILLLVITITSIGCQSKYEKEMELWRSNRLKDLKDPYGWPSVTGLFHLRNSLAYFGRGDGNDFIIPNGASSFGILIKTDTAVVMSAYTSLDVLVDSQAVGTIPMYSDLQPNGPTLAFWNSLQWHIIERDSQYYLRVKDTLSPYRQALTEIPYFPAKEEYKINARVIDRGERPETITYSNILGMNITNPVAAYIAFDWEGTEYVLTALENDEHTYYIMIHDLTSGETTYGGGRYLYPAKANINGQVDLDFNKLINPPCVFTPFATCPLPPKANYLPFSIEAGEQMMHLY